MPGDLKCLIQGVSGGADGEPGAADVILVPDHVQARSHWIKIGMTSGVVTLLHKTHQVDFLH